MKLFPIIEVSQIRKYQRPLPYTYHFHHMFFTVHMAPVIKCHRHVVQVTTHM